LTRPPDMSETADVPVLSAPLNPLAAPFEYGAGGMKAAEGAGQAAVSANAGGIPSSFKAAPPASGTSGISGADARPAQSSEDEILVLNRMIDSLPCYDSYVDMSRHVVDRLKACGPELPRRMVIGDEHGRAASLALCLTHMAAHAATPGRKVVAIELHPDAFKTPKLLNPKDPAICRAQDNIDAQRHVLDGIEWASDVPQVRAEDANDVLIAAMAHRWGFELRGIDTNRVLDASGEENHAIADSRDRGMQTEWKDAQQTADVLIGFVGTLHAGALIESTTGAKPPWTAALFLPVEEDWGNVLTKLNTLLSQRDKMLLLKSTNCGELPAPADTVRLLRSLDKLTPDGWGKVGKTPASVGL